MKGNSEIVRKKKRSFKTKLDVDRNLIVELVEEPTINRKESLTIILNGIFSSHIFENGSGGGKKLFLNANCVIPRLGRCFRDCDVPILLRFLKDNPEVTEVNLANNEIHCPGFCNIIDHIIRENRVVNLNMNNNEIGSSGITHFCAIGEKLQLQVLRLSGNKFGVESSQEIALFLLKNRFLQHLDIAEVDQTASSLVYFTSVLRANENFYNSTLKSLDISRPNPGCMYHFDTANFASLVGSMLKNNNCLEKLYLRKFGFFCHDIEILLNDGARHNKNLLFLNLSCNNIGDFGVELLANWLAKRPKLTGLSIAHNIVTYTGAAALSHGIPYSKLRYLDVSYNRINDLGITEMLNSIKKSPYMRHLRIYGNAVGSETSKIINRMLLSGVLIQENLDVKPYVVDNEWFCARYPATRCDLDPEN